MLSSDVPSENLELEVPPLSEVLTIFLKLLLQRSPYPVRLLLWVLIQEQLYALMLQPVIPVIDNESFDAACQLIDLPKEPLLPGLRDLGDRRTCPRVLLTNHITVIRPHVLQNVEDVRIVTHLRETHHIKLLL